jgi:hypothetical protein
MGEVAAERPTTAAMDRQSTKAAMITAIWNAARYGVSAKVPGDHRAARGRSRSGSFVEWSCHWFPCGKSKWMDLVLIKLGDGG